MRSIPILRAAVSGLILLTLPILPAANCAANGGISHICCSDRCACPDHGARDEHGGAEHESAAAHSEAAHGEAAHRAASAPSPHDRSHDDRPHRTAERDGVDVGASCALTPDPDRPSPGAPASAGVNISNLRPVILVTVADLPPLAGVRYRYVATAGEARERAGDVRTPPPRSQRLT